MTIDKLKEEAKSLPLLPGVYLMKDKDDYIIYVGKSKHLKNRVSSYFGSLKNAKQKVKRMVANVDHFTIQVTDTELEALLLECELIKKYKPIYNRLLKNDKKYRYIKVDVESKLGTVHGVYNKGKEGVFFGPYDKSSDLLLAVEGLREYYKLPNCNKIDDYNSCITYQFGKCIGHCDNTKIPLHDSLIDKIISFLDGRSDEPIKAYEKAMNEAAVEMNFDKAIKYRDYLYALRRLGYKQEAITFSLANRRGIALLECPKGGHKLFLLAGTTIIQSMYIKDITNSNVYNKCIDFVCEYLNNQFEPQSSIEKTKVDSHLIVYSYLIINMNDNYRQIDKATDINYLVKELLKIYA